MSEPKIFAAEADLRRRAERAASDVLWDWRVARDRTYHPVRNSESCPDCGTPYASSGRPGTPPACPCEEEVDRLAYAEQLTSNRPGAVAELWSRSSVPSRFRGCTFDTFRARPGVEKALASCRSYAESFSPDTAEGLWLIGEFGTGKTHLAAAIGRAVTNQHLAGVRFTTAADLVAAVRPAPGERDFNWDMVDDAIGAELLILDDVGQEQSSPFARDVIYRVLNGRYEAQMPLILTSNAGDEQLEERLGGAAVSRLYEMTQPLILKAKDYRAELARSRSAA